MSIEAAAGKNPMTHVGKIYNVLACDIADGLTVEVPEIADAHCLMVSQSGAPVTRPALVQLKLETRDGQPLGSLRPDVEEIVAAHLTHAPQLNNDFVSGTIELF
jgi:S-adenosylmethionine synthetase